MNDGDHLMAKRMGNKYRDHQTRKKTCSQKEQDTNFQPRCYEEMMDRNAAKQRNL